MYDLWHMKDRSVFTGSNYNLGTCVCTKIGND